MREIKFRAWDKLSNKMRLVKSLNYADDGFAKTIVVHLVDGVTYGYVHGESCELMQYIGIKDASGQDVYEGDIIQWDTTGWFEDDMLVSLIGTVCFNNGDIYVCSDGENYALCTCDDIKVIGNVYENPEWLEAK